MIRERISEDLKLAVKAKEAERVATLRLILAAIKDREIAERSGEAGGDLSDAVVLAILEKMVKQRRESAGMYDEAGRLDLADQERGEIRIIQHYLPKQLSDQEVQSAIDRAIRDTGATCVRDMGRVMAKLKARHAGQMDFSEVGAAIKDAFR